MISSSHTFECITPCFCAGADQAKAEIRSSAIRGALRWWFRALGGSADAETEVFGGSKPVTASSVLIRVSGVRADFCTEGHRGLGVSKLNASC